MISAFFIRRPVATALLAIAVVVFGFMGYRRLPVSDLPNVDLPTLQVSATLPGASPETMAAAVATPLERQFTTIAGLETMTSTSSQGQTSISLQFALERDIDAAAQDVQAAIAQAQRQLPPEMPTPPSYRKVNPADQPVIYLAVSSATLPLSKVNEYAETLMGQRISMSPGVAQVQVFGSQKFAVRIQLDPSALAARGIGIDEVEQAIRSHNVNMPSGALQGPRQAFTLETTGQLLDAAGYRKSIVAYRDGAPVRLEELGRVLDSVQNNRVASWYNDARAVVLAVQRQPGTNTVAVVDGIRRLLPALRAQIPAAVAVDVVFDRSESIRASVHDVQLTLIIAILLVVAVVFVFLRNVSATIIPGAAVPLSIIGTFAVMHELGYSLDNLSLMALTLSVGFVVDDAIVMLENIVRHMESGTPRLRAALDGAREIGFTIVSMTISLVAVFIPVLFMGGILGRLLREFSVTITVAILLSGLIALSLTPMLASRFLRPPRAGPRGRLFQRSERAFETMVTAYHASLDWSLRHRRMVALSLVATIAATGFLLVIVPKGFIPSEDQGQIFGYTEAGQDVSFDAMVQYQRAVAAVVRANPDVDAVMSSVGVGGATTGTNSGIIFARLKPLSERPGVDEVIAQLRGPVNAIPGVRVFLQNPPTIRVGGQLTKSLYQYTLQSNDLPTLYRWGPIMEARVRRIPGLLDVTSDLQIATPQITIDIDRDKASALGVTAAQIENALYDAYGQRQVSTIYTPVDQYWVIMEVLPEYQKDPAALSLLYIRPAGDGALVPLSAVARMQRGVGALTINHVAEQPAVTISFNLGPGVSLGQAIQEIRAVEHQAGMPASVTTTFQGAAQAFQSSLQGLGLLLLVAIFVIYVVLGILYESFVHPVTILSGLPAAGVGALLTLLLFHRELDFYGFVGIIMLVGIVKKNAIMMIDFAIEARHAGRAPVDAIREGALVRFRPIMMTTVAAIMGVLPIALGIGAGADARRLLGLAVVGGLLLSQLLTLYVTPVVYLYLESARDTLVPSLRREWLSLRHLGFRRAGP